MTKCFSLNAISLSIIALSLLSACDTIPVIVPEVESKAPVEITNHNELALMGFDRIGIKIKRGEPIGSYDIDILGVSGCAGMGGNVFWNQGRVLAKDVEFSDLFYAEMKNANFNVAGSPNKLFSNITKGKIKPRFLVGGQLEEIKMNVCDELSFWTGRRLGRQSGKGAVRVTWQLFDTTKRKVVYETETRGAVNNKDGVPNGEMLIIQNAFAAATANLAADEKLVSLLQERQDTIADIRKIEDTKMRVHRFPNWKSGITQNIDQIRRSVVTIESGMGHGSGFFISPTLLLTNYHVVEGSEFVRIKLLTGRKIIGDVIRKHLERDIALIQVEKSGHIPIPIRKKSLKITEEVYAIGSPLDQALSGTVTKGIVSKFSSNQYGLEHIQADVDIQGGNSGGTLLDKNGNVVGISYAGISSDDQTSIGINYFIPIMDALEKLNVSFKKGVPSG